MKKLLLPFFAFIIFFAFAPAHAQSQESIWLTVSASSFKTGETVVVTVNGASAAPIQGITFQVGYDPACMKPVNAATAIPGMNGLSLPQIDGLVDASFASTTPQTANGVLAEVRFITLGACNTNVHLESAALVVKNESGFAAPMPGVTVDGQNIALAISAEKGTSQDLPLLGTPLSLGDEPDGTEQASLSSGTVVMLALICILLLVGIFFLIRVLRSDDPRG